MSDTSSPEERNGTTCALFVVRDLVCGNGSAWSGVERMTALALGDHIGGRGEAWPSLRRLAAWTGFDKSTIIRALGKLTGPGGIFDVRRGGSLRGGRRLANVYSLRPVAKSNRYRSATGSGEQPGPVAESNPTGSGEQPQRPMNVPIERPITAQSRGGASSGLFGNVEADTEAPPRMAIKLVKRRQKGKGTQSWPATWPANAVGIALDTWKPYGAVAAGPLTGALKLIARDGWAWADVIGSLEKFLAAGRASLGPTVWARSVGEITTGRGGLTPMASGRGRDAERDARSHATLERFVNAGR